MIECCLHRYDLTDGMQYNFPLDGVTATYVAKKDCFVPSQVSHTVVVSRSGCGLPHPLWCSYSCSNMGALLCVLCR